MMLTLLQICSESPNPHACHLSWSTSVCRAICVLAKPVIYLAKRRENDRGNRCGRWAGSASPMLDHGWLHLMTASTSPVHIRTYRT